MKIFFTVISSLFVGLAVGLLFSSSFSHVGRYQIVSLIGAGGPLPGCFYRIDTATGETQVFVWDDRGIGLIKIGSIPKWSDYGKRENLRMITTQELIHRGKQVEPAPPAPEATPGPSR